MEHVTDAILVLGNLIATAKLVAIASRVKNAPEKKYYQVYLETLTTDYGRFRL